MSFTRHDPSREIHAPRGTEISAKSWQTEAPMRMLMNNLDPEVAERPEDLVVYGGTGRAARSWEAYDAIIESPGYVDRFGINMIEGITLPTACAATCSVSVSVQRLSVEAAMTGDIDTLKLAVLHDPLVGAICTPEEVWQMVDELLVAQAKWLPQYADSIPGAAARLEAPRVQTRTWAGAARRNVRSVEELRAGRAASDAAEGHHGLGTKVMG